MRKENRKQQRVEQNGKLNEEKREKKKTYWDPFKENALWPYVMLRVMPWVDIEVVGNRITTHQRPPWPLIVRH